MWRIAELGVLGMLVSRCFAALDGSRYLWYDAPAADWETGALPIGCGRLGATVFGGSTEVMAITEDTIWTGPIQERVPQDGLEALPRVRELLLAGDITAGGQMVLQDMTPTEASERSFSYFGNLNFAFAHDDVSNYTRWLDTRQGNAGVSYTYENTQYSREFIASHPSDVLAARFTSSKNNALQIKASMSRLENILSNEVSIEDGKSSITLRGSSGQDASENPILFSGTARFVAEGADISSYDGNLIITGATTIDVFFDAETNVRYSEQQDLEDQINGKLDRAVEQGFEELRSEALEDSSALLGRASLDLGSSPNGLADLPTDQRVANAREDDRDIQLSTLVWNYGRHLLVAASRNTDADVDMPANLQGVWNNKTSAAWGGKFTININTEMNYWPAASTNIIETQQPLFDLLRIAQPRGQEMAQKLYGCNGTVFHHNLDLWGDPAPTDNFTSSTMWPMGAAWLVQHMIDHYRYTGDRGFLQDTVYPYLVDVARFYECYAFEWEGSRVTGPSLSPENTFIVPDNMTVAGNVEPMDVAVEMDNQLMRDVMSSLLEAAEVLGISETDEDVAAAKAFLPQIREARIGSLGQILEWRYEYDESDQGHRHLSPLYGLHPSKQFSPLVNETLSRAANVLLDRRVDGGSGSTGWSRTWLINQYARLHSGSEAWKHVRAWFAKFPTANLWNTDNGSGFQIDGNYGFTSGITEMLLQSHADVVHILPALPSEASASGNVKGLMARGGFQVDIEWKGGAFREATLKSTLGGRLSLRVADGTEISVNGTPYEGPISTSQGSKYVVTVA